MQPISWACHTLRWHQLPSAEHLLQQVTTSHYTSSPSHRPQAQTKHTQGIFRVASSQDMFSLFSPDCPGIHSIDQSGLELKDPLASTPQTLGLRVCTTATLPGLPLSGAFLSEHLQTHIVLHSRPPLALPWKGALALQLPTTAFFFFS